MADFRTNQQFVTPRYPFAFGTPAGHPRLVRSPSTVTIEVKVNNAPAVAALFEKSARISRPRHIVINCKSSALDTGPPKNDDRVREVSCSFILNSALGRRIVQSVSDGTGVRLIGRIWLLIPLARKHPKCSNSAPKNCSVRNIGLLKGACDDDAEASVPVVAA
jgi:hypothetical protein